MSKGKNVLTTGDVAKICNVAPRTVSKWFDTGQLKGYRIPGSKDRRIPLSELMRFMKQHGMPTDSLKGAGKMRVLLVCSDEQAGSKLQQYLRDKADYEVKVVGNDFETGITAHKFEPHVMLIDLTNGQTAASGICKSIRSDEELQAIKIIAMVNKPSEEEQVLLRQGFDAIVGKHEGPEQIIRQIEQATAIIY
ncbi:MAG: helix-turn-helix domain-containing protein [Phycisphaerae bacterium]